jgi:hypothetical protein
LATGVRLLLRCICILELIAVLTLPVPARAQDSSASIEQSRLFQRTTPPNPSEVTTGSTSVLSTDGTTSDDESFGAQQLLKSQEKTPTIFLSGDAAFFYTSNVALTHHDTISDGFFVGDAGASWTPRLGPDVQGQIGARASIFRYFETSVLDFENLGAGTGVVWTPRKYPGVALAARYDFIELLNKHSDELLQDHEFTLTAQKVIPFGRSHALSVALVGSAGISDPVVEQRDQAGFSVGYHVQISRSFEGDLGYRHSWYFYNKGGRTDLNQVGSLGLHYHVNRWATIDGFLSGATNYSNRDSFKYNALTSGGGVGFTVHF